MRARRDSFARITYTPEAIPSNVVAVGGCSWDGQRPAPRHPLYRVRVEHDGGRSERARGQFCSWSCFEGYHDTKVAR